MKLQKRFLCLLFTISFLALSVSPLLAKKRFRRVYRGARTVTIRHQGRTKKVPTNTYYSAYKETNYRLLPNWRPMTKENTRGIQNLWRVTDRNRRLHQTPHGKLVNPRRPYPNPVEAFRVNDYIDNFNGKR